MNSTKKTEVFFVGEDINSVAIKNDTIINITLAVQPNTAPLSLVSPVTSLLISARV